VATGCDLANVECVLATVARRGWATDTFVAVVSTTEYAVVSSALLAEHFGCKGVGTDAAVRLRDKVLQKRAVSEAGVSTARLLAVHEPGNEDVDRHWQEKVVVKPVGSSGTVGVQVVSASTGRENVSAKTPRPLGSEVAYMVEAFVDGHEVQVDGTIHDGVLGPFAISRYFANPYSVRDGNPVGAVVLPRCLHARDYVEVQSMVEVALRALGHVNGVFHLEMFSTKDGWVFGECAGRASGGDIDRAIERSADFSLHRNWARATLGLGPLAWSAQELHSSKYWGDVQLVSGDGTVVEMPAEDAIHSQPGVVEARLRRVVGDLVEGSSGTTFQHAAAAIVQGDSFEETEKLADALAAWFLKNSRTVARGDDR
jgi:biotin carboxylase